MQQCFLLTQVHLLIGQGSVNETLSFDLRGAFNVVAGSPNDLLFFPHHLKVDCVLEEYFKRHRNTEYPVHPQIRDGHRANDYIRTFFPLYTNQKLFTKNTEKFGYYCSLPNVGITDPEGKHILLQINFKSEDCIARKFQTHFL